MGKSFSFLNFENLCLHLSVSLMDQPSSSEVYIGDQAVANECVVFHAQRRCRKLNLSRVANGNNLKRSLNLLASTVALRMDDKNRLAVESFEREWTREFHG